MFSLIERNIHGVLPAYKQIYEEIKNEPPWTPPQEEPQAGPSGGVPEEAIVITGDDSSMCVIVPEDLPMGQWDTRCRRGIVMLITLCRPRLLCLCLSFKRKKCLKSKK